MSTLEIPFLQKEINGTTYHAYTLKLDQWSELTEWLASLLGGPMGELLRGDDASATAGKELSDGLLSMLVPVIQKLTAKRITELTKHLARSVRSDGSLLTTEKQTLYWPQHMRDLAPVTKLFLEAQYADFFTGIGDIMSDLPVTTKEQQD